MIDLKFVEKLLDLLSRSEADTIEIRKWSTTVRVSKSVGVTVQSSGSNARPEASGPVAVAASGKAAPQGEGPAAAGEESGQLTEIKSPMVGTFYAQPEPGAEPYVKVGSRISVGQTLCIIEAMKIMNPLDAEVSGVIKEIAAQDAQPVEFGQVLFRVDPNG
ncbi:MAG: acetyl-CoA carboxylase biotin carboxyl carrier protein [Gemmatimonadales bacterium]